MELFSFGDNYYRLRCNIMDSDTIKRKKDRNELEPERYVVFVEEITKREQLLFGRLNWPWTSIFHDLLCRRWYCRWRWWWVDENDICRTILHVYACLVGLGGHEKSENEEPPSLTIISAQKPNKCRHFELT